MANGYQEHFLEWEWWVMGVFKNLSKRGALAGVGCLALLAAPLVAQVVLSADQIAAIQSSLTAALSAAKGEDAIQAAIASAEKGAVLLYGNGAAAQITSVVMETSEKSNVGLCTIGRGLGDAAAGMAPSSVSSANAVASTIANEGQDLERTCFETAVNEKGYSNLASIAGQGPTATGATGGIGAGGGGGGFTGGGAAGGGGGGCLNPSCTSL